MKSNQAFLQQSKMMLQKEMKSDQAFLQQSKNVASKRK
jgi:hypothetical protein